MKGWRVVSAGLSLTVMVPAGTGAFGTRSQSTEADSTLLGELGCAACHAGTGTTPELVRSRAPTLAHVGARLSTAYLFDYLASPNTIRHAIGRSRMPTFPLDEPERLALAMYLGTLGGAPAEVAALPTALRDVEPSEPAPDRAQAAMTESGCYACHELNGRGNRLGPDLSGVGARLRPGFLIPYLANPRAWEPTTAMPALFVDSAGNELREGAVTRMAMVAGYLASLGGDEAEEHDATLARAREASPEVTAETGRQIFDALNCAGCHRGAGPAPGAVAPPLSAAQRLRPAWLRQYLAAPHAVRPFGFEPGTGSRMPDFRLAADEVEEVLDGVLEAAGPVTVLPAFEAQPLSAFAQDKARQLIRDRYPCLGCHELDGTGGRIGPDLSGAGARLTEPGIYGMIVDPQHVVPESVMPRRPMQQDRATLLASFLAGMNGPRSTSYGSLVTSPPRPRTGPEAADGAELYQRYCAACHGETGLGDGYNVPFLPVPPTVHADSAYMATRPDDTLYDGTHVGGFVLDKSHRMPGFGEIMSGPQIRAVVAYMRQVCRCEGPAWSRPVPR